MRVLVNGLVSLGARTGIGHYAGELVRSLRAQTGDAAVDVFPPAWLASVHRVWGRCRSRIDRSTDAPVRAQEASSGPSWRARLLTGLRAGGQVFLERCFQAASRTGYDLYHEPNVVPFSCDLPTVTTVHDLSVLLHPEWHPAHRVAHHQKRFAAGLARSCHVVTGSEFTRQEVIATLGLPPERVSRTYHGIRPNLRPLPAERVEAGRRALGLPGRYLLFLGTLEPRKNARMLLEAYCALPESLRRRCPLVLAGAGGWGAAQTHDYIDRVARHRGVLRLGYVADEQLAALYNAARALLFPSFYEGFGLPPVEMMACGGAVIASTAGAVREVAGGRAHLLDPHDRDGWHHAMRRAIADDDWCAALRQGAEEAARPFTWERCAEQTLAVYRRVLQGTDDLRRPRAA
jgi:alpha-1,3-rhamnosyl/mannosyltransferase